MRRIVIALAAALLAAPAFGQSAQVLSGGCATASYGAGGQQLTMAPDGTLCTSAKVTGTFSSASVGLNNATGPTSSDQIGSVDGSGKLQPASSTNPLPVSLPAGFATSALQTSVGATAHTDAAAINTTLGTPFQASGSVGNTSFGATSVAAATTNSSSTIATGGTFQQLAALSATRKSIEFQNTNAADKCYLFFGASGEATTNSIVVAAGQSYLRSSGYIPSDRVAATCATTSDTFYFAVQ